MLSICLIFLIASFLFYWYKTARIIALHSIATVTSLSNVNHHNPLPGFWIASWLSLLIIYSPFNTQGELSLNINQITSHLVLQRRFIGFRVKSYKALRELTSAFPGFTSLLGPPPATQESFLFLEHVKYVLVWEICNNCFCVRGAICLVLPWIIPSHSLGPNTHSHPWSLSRISLHINFYISH